MDKNEALKRAAKALIGRIGPSTMPIEVKIIGTSCVEARDPGTGARAYYDFSRSRLMCTRYVGP